MSCGLEEQIIVSKNGNGKTTKLFVRQWSPPTTTTTVAKLLIVHGFLEHGGRYQEMAEYLASKHGIATIVYDVRGHGKSSGQRAYCSSMKGYFDDLETMLDYAQQTQSSTTVTTTTTSSSSPPSSDPAADSSTTLPLFVFCHSFGGLTFLDYARQQQQQQVTQSQKLTMIQGVILSAPFVGMAVKVSPAKIKTSKVLGKWFPRLPVRGESLLLTHDPEKQRQHDEDPLILHNVTTGWAKTCLEAQARVCDNEPLPLPMPLLYLIAEQDQVSNVNDVTMVGKNILQQKDKTIVVRTREYHEMHNEVKRQEVYELMAEWITRRRLA